MNRSHLIGARLVLLLTAKTRSPPKPPNSKTQAMTDLPIQCVKNVVLETTRDDGEIDRSTLQMDLVLRKEVGNARLVSGDAVLWVGKGVLSHKDSTVKSVPTRTVRIENRKRRFVFTVVLDAAGKQFYTDLKDQVDAKARVEVRKKKRKIRTQLSRGTGFTPVNTLKSPATSPSLLLPTPTKKLALTPKRAPLADIGTPQRTPQLALPPPLPVTLKESTSHLTSPLRSPFRSPFRKKVRRSQSPSHRLVDLSSPYLRSPARDRLSTTQSVKLRSGSTPLDIKQRNSRTPVRESAQIGERSDGSPCDRHRRKSITGSINKRVRSLQLMLDDESVVKEPAMDDKKKITSHFFKTNSPSCHPHDSAAGVFDKPLESIAPAADGSDPSGGESPTDEAHRSTHGLLNLGNYCYMNAIVQALAALPAFVSAVSNEENLLQIIRKQPCASAKVMTSEQLKTIFNDWRNSGDSKHLPLQYALSQLLQLVVNGSETSINPEFLKNVMGKKNSMFATHFQQDAHEFLLNVVTEYEKELVDMVHEMIKMIQGEPKSSPQAQRNGVTSFLRNGSKASDGQHETASGSADVELKLICRLPPAKCFRAELSRTLTCQRCGYSRKQAETYYDFSLDLPYYPVSELEPVAEQEPTAEREPQASPSLGRRCFCKLVPHVTGVDDDCYYCCTNSSCSYREKVVDSGGCRTSPAKLTDTGVNSASSSLSPISGWPSRPAPIELETLLQKQFETEVLELTCEKCKDGKEAQSAYEVKSLPSILVLHLKRFEVDPQTGVLFKRCDLVVPPPVIDPVRSIDNSSSSGSEQHYMLKSVIHHLGKNIDEGHYVADVCDAHGQWIRRNDTHESKISIDYALQSYRSQESCYMFFYVKSERSGTDEGKENVPSNRTTAQNENDATSSRQRGGSRSDGLRAFL